MKGTLGAFPPSVLTTDRFWRESGHRRGSRWSTIRGQHLNSKQFSAPIAADTNRNTNKLTRAISWLK
jgi:hypothetical protein